MGLTNAGERYTLGLMKDAGPYYMALFTVAPTESSDGVEVAGGSYARVICQLTTPDTDEDGVTSMKNADALEFPTASAEWGTVTAWGLYDAEYGGNLIWYGSLATSKALTADDTVLIHANDLVLRMD